MAGAEQSLFLAVPEGEEDRPAWPLWQPLHRLHQFQEAGHAGGVVVGTVVDEAERAVAVVGVAIAHVVVVGAHDHQFVGCRGIASGLENEDVPHRAERLVEGPGVTGGLEAGAGGFPEPLDLGDDVRPGGPAAAAAPLAALEGVVSQRGYVPARIGGADARVRLGEHFGRRRRMMGRGQGEHGGQGCNGTHRTPPCGTAARGPE